MIFNTTRETFNDLIYTTGVPVLIDFYAPWCGPCKMLSPVLEKLDEKHKGKVKIVKVNTDEYPDIAAMFSVSNLPTLVLMYNQTFVNKIIGFKNIKELEDFIFS